MYDDGVVTEMSRPQLDLKLHLMATQRPTQRLQEMSTILYSMRLFSLINFANHVKALLLLPLMSTWNLKYLKSCARRNLQLHDSRNLHSFSRRFQITD